MSSPYYRPAPPLSEYVEFFWLLTHPGAPHAQERVLPTGTMELVIDLASDNPATGIVVGLRSEHFLLDTGQAFTVLGVHFRPGGAFPFFGPSGEMRDQLAPLDALWNAFAYSVREQILEAPTSAARFRILECALLSKLRGQAPRHPAVTYALSCFDAHPGRSVADVTASLGLTPRRFIDVFRDQVGVTPKAFARIRRFQHVLGSLDRARDVDWSDVALSCGYFDQAHFNHEFRGFTGITPSAYLRNRTSRNHVAVRD